MSKIKYTFIIYLYVLTAYSQTIAPPIIAPTSTVEPLNKPKYLFIAQTDNPNKLLKIIKDTLALHGFKIETYDMGEGIIEASKLDDEKSQNYDKVLIWLERDLNNPNKYLRVHFLYGRYLFIIGSTSKVSRVVVTDSEEHKRIGKLKHSLISITNIFGD